MKKAEEYLTEENYGLPYSVVSDMFLEMIGELEGIIDSSVTSDGANLVVAKTRAYNKVWNQVCELRPDYAHDLFKDMAKETMQSTAKELGIVVLDRALEYL